MKWFLLVVALFPAVAFSIDASVPDASIGMGGNGDPMEEGEMSDPCLDSSDCDNGATCTNGQCVPVQPRKAIGACGGSAQAFGTIFMLGIGAVAWSKRRGA